MSDALSDLFKETDPPTQRSKRLLMYRAKDLQGKWVKGYWFSVHGKHYIILNGAFISHDNGLHYFVEIDPTTLAMNTTFCGKHGNTIYGSFKVAGVMSKGGDRIKYEWHDSEYQEGESYEGDVYFDKGAFWLQMTLDSYGPHNLEIIGPACDLGDKK